MIVIAVLIWGKGRDVNEKKEIDETKKLAKLSDELITYFIENGADRVNVDVKLKEYGTQGYWKKCKTK